MNKIFEYCINHRPIPWKRAQRCGNRYFDAQSTLKKHLQKCFNYLYPKHVPFCEPIFVEFIFHFKQPKFKKKIYHTGRPDLSNLIKFYEDCFNGYIWEDDSIIVGYVNSRKEYQENESVQIRVYTSEVFTSDNYIQ